MWSIQKMEMIDIFYMLLLLAIGWVIGLFSHLLIIVLSDGMVIMKKDWKEFEKWQKNLIR